MQNYGVILEQVKPEDYKFGGVNGVYNNITIEDGNWVDYLPTKEFQKVGKLETMSCISQSAHSSLEIIFKYLIKNNVLEEDDLKFLQEEGYFDENGNVNFNDRFTAIMSLTTKDGNSLSAVGQAITNVGLIPEADFKLNKENPVWNDYYIGQLNVPQELKDKAKRFLERFNITYEVVKFQDFAKALKHAPLQVIVFAWEKNANGEYVNNKGEYNHGVVKIMIDPNDIFDTYSPFIKQLEANYPYWQVAFKYNITKKITSKIMQVKDNYLYKLVEGSQQIVALGLDGGLMWNEGEGQFQTLMEFIARNNGDIKDKIISVNMADWNSVEHYDMKKNKR